MIWSLPSPLQIHQKISTCVTTLTEHLLNTGRSPQTPKRARKSPSNWVRQKTKKKKKTTEKEIGMGAAPLGGRCEGGKVSTHWEVPSPVGTERELWSLGGEHSNKCAEGKAERPAQSVGADPHFPA